MNCSLPAKEINSKSANAKTLVHEPLPLKTVEAKALLVLLYNYPPNGRWIVVEMGKKKCRFINGHNFFWNFRETTRHFSLRSQNSEYLRIFRVTGANQNARILLSTDLVNTNNNYSSSPNGLWVNSRMGYWLRGYEGERNNCFIKIQLVAQKNIETKHLSQVKARHQSFFTAKTLQIWRALFATSGLQHIAY